MFTLIIIFGFHEHVGKGIPQDARAKRPCSEVKYGFKAGFFMKSQKHGSCTFRFLQHSGDNLSPMIIPGTHPVISIVLQGGFVDWGLMPFDLIGAVDDKRVTTNAMTTIVGIFMPSDFISTSSAFLCLYVLEEIFYLGMVVLIFIDMNNWKIWDCATDPV